MIIGFQCPLLFDHPAATTAIIRRTSDRDTGAGSDLTETLNLDSIIVPVETGIQYAADSRFYRIPAFRGNDEEAFLLRSILS